MKKISELLSSFHYTFWNLIVIFLWFSFACILASYDEFSSGFYLMNKLLVRNWLVSGSKNFFLLKFWFVALCVLVGLLSLNLIFCSWKKIFKFLNIRLNGPKFLMLLAHIIFGLVAVCHFSGFMLGYKHTNVRLRQGQTFLLQNGEKLKVTNIHFIDDPSILHQSNKKLTQNDFHYHLNYVELEINQKHKDIIKGKAFIFKPMRNKNVQVTLKKFSPPLSSNNNKEAIPGVVISISKNPALNLFLLFYLLMIVVIAMYMLMTWRISNKTNSIIKGGM